MANLDAALLKDAKGVVLTGTSHFILHPPVYAILYSLYTLYHKSMNTHVTHLLTRLMYIDERLLVSILCRRTKSQIKAIDLAYRTKFDIPLKKYLERSTGGNLENFLVYLQMSEEEFDSYCLHQAFAGMGCSKNIVVEILTTRPFARIQAARCVQ